VRAKLPLRAWSDGTLTITATCDRLGRVLTVDDNADGTPDSTYTYSLTSPAWTDPTGTYGVTLDAFDRAAALDDPVNAADFTWAYRADGQPSSTHARALSAAVGARHPNRSTRALVLSTMCVEITPRPSDIPAGSAIGGGQQQPQAERGTVMAGVLTLFGLLTYALIWSDPSAVPYPGGPGEWHSAPAWCRRLLRRGNGPVLIAAVSVQAAAATTAIFGMLRWIGILEYPLSAVGAWIVVISWCASLAVWGLVALRARRWRR
jgi:hypothetical protein